MYLNHDWRQIKDGYNPAGVLIQKVLSISHFNSLPTFLLV